MIFKLACLQNISFKRFSRPLLSLPYHINLLPLPPSHYFSFSFSFILLHTNSCTITYFSYSFFFSFSLFLYLLLRKDIHECIGEVGGVHLHLFAFHFSHFHPLQPIPRRVGSLLPALRFFLLSLLDLLFLSLCLPLLLRGAGRVGEFQYYFVWFHVFFVFIIWLSPFLSLVLSFILFLIIFWWKIIGCFEGEGGGREGGWREGASTCADCDVDSSY
jgi:hypothetical protein